LSKRDEQPRCPAIFGCEGTTLTPSEVSFFAAVRPAGFILFARNCESKSQIRALTDRLRELAANDDVPILIDQEGGRVARLRPPLWRASPPAALFGAMYAHDPDRACAAALLNSRLIAHELHELGITVDCLPVLDVPQPGSHDIIGDRAYGTTPAQIVALARAAADGLRQGGVLPVIKHIPGHGRAQADSHIALPTVDAAESALDAVDFAPFRALADLPFAMTAHVLYTALDPSAPATLSARVVNRVIRSHMNYDGVLMTDDLSMQALQGDFAFRTRRSLDAGCDLVLHCNGKMSEMIEIAAATGPIGLRAGDRLARARAHRHAPGSFDPIAGSRDFARLIQGHEWTG